MSKTMRPIATIFCILLVALILLPTASFGGPFEDGQDAYDRGDYTAALRIWRPLAEQGEARAQLLLGGLYVDGEGVAQNNLEALKWFRKAAEQGYARGQAAVGFMYANGLGVSKNDTEASKWYRKAAEQGHAKAQNWMGESYLQGEGAPKSDTEAVKWFRKAAEQGESWGQYRLGWMYDQGRGVSQNYAEAGKWYRSAAEQGEAWAQYFLAGLYHFERGVPREHAQAYVWYNLAAARAGSDESLRDLAESGRESVASSLTRDQLLHAQELAENWQPNNPDQPGAVAKSNPESKPQPKPEVQKEMPRTTVRLIAGTGFFVTTNGHLLTNAHVVENCRELKVRQAGGSVSLASVVDRDGQNDLALLKSASAAPAVARFSAQREPRLGQSIVVYGFPLSGLLSSSGNLTTGNIAALAGPGDDVRLMQVSAPIQRGNSGGPVLNSMGAVIGVVVSKLDALAVAEKTRDVPQNVNFAIKGNVAARFLDSKGIKYSISSDDEDIPVEAIGEIATQFTVRVECLQEPRAPR